MGSQRVGNDWMTNAIHIYLCIKYILILISFYYWYAISIMYYTFIIQLYIHIYREKRGGDQCPSNYNLLPYQEKCMHHVVKSSDSAWTHPAHLMAVFLWSYRWIGLKSTWSVACLFISQLNYPLRGGTYISRMLLVKWKYSKYSKLNVTLTVCLKIEPV